MEPSAFDQLLRLGDELQADYGHMFDVGDQLNPFDGPMDGDSLSLLMADLDTPCSTTSSIASSAYSTYYSTYSGHASQSSASSSPAASHASSASTNNSSCFQYQDMLSNGSPLLLESPPPLHPEMGGGMMSGHYEDYASPAGTYASSDDSGHHSPATSSVDHHSLSVDQQQHSHHSSLLYDVEAGGGGGGCYEYGYGQQPQLQLHHTQHQLQRRSSSEDSDAAMAPPSAARRVLHLHPQQRQPVATAAVEQQQQQAQPAPRVVYVLPQQQQQKAAPPPAASSTAYNVAHQQQQRLPAKVVPARPQQQPQLQLHQAARPPPPPTAAAAAQPYPKTTVLLARTTPCVQFVSSHGTATLLAQVKVEPKEEITEEEDLQYFRKQEDRKQKNRAAAQQSRLRRRGELEELRTTVGELTSRNRELEEENGRLKRRVDELEAQFHWSPPRKRVAVAGAAATTCLMVFVMMFAFQTTTPLDRSMSHFSLPIPVSRQISETAGSAHSRVVRDVSAEVAPKTRALLAIEDYDEEAAAKKDSAELTAYAEKLARATNVTRKEGGGEGCGDKAGAKRYPNQTETIRLNTELNNWVESHDLVEWASGLQGGRRMFTLSAGLGKRRRLVPEKEEQRRAKNGTVSPISPPTRGAAASSSAHHIATNATMPEEGKKQPKKKSPRGEAKREAAKERAMRDRAWKHLDMVSPGLREHGPENRPDWSATGSEQPERLNRRLVGGVGDKERDWQEAYERLAAAVQQRTDTLYVVAMKDYLLLPAMERNATSRPRVSLILPAVMNGTMTTANNQVMLMRLDLDVVGTGLIHLAEGLLPFFQNLSIY